MSASPPPTSPQNALVLPTPALQKLATYVFAELDMLKAQAVESGMTLIDLGMGNPDVPTPRPIVDAMHAAIDKPENHRYPPFEGKPAFRQAVARFMQRRYQVTVDPNTQVQALIGSKEGIGHLTFAYVGEGDIALAPCPFYPVYNRAPLLAGGEVYQMPLLEANGFLPDLAAIPPEVLKRAKVLFINYPNNPTAATADLAFYEKLVAFGKQHGIIIASDLAYGEIGFDGYRPPSVLQVPGALDIAVEFHSFSKSFNMAGWRLGFAVGAAPIIKSLFNLKTNIDYGVSPAIQEAAVVALDRAEEFLPEIVATYQARRDVVIEGFKSLGWPVPAPPKATLYVWLPVPPGMTSTDWCKHLIREVGVVITPGVAFGPQGDAYFRVSLVSPKETLMSAIARLKEKGIRYEQPQYP
ncbi:MAG: LL-diaminopimelate aminotransferase [Candidatus Melainabacteria bacterium]